jgi:hypothetical protein
VAKILDRDDDGLDQGWEATLEYISLTSSRKQGIMAGPVPAIDVLPSQKRTVDARDVGALCPRMVGGET